MELIQRTSGRKSRVTVPLNKFYDVGTGEQFRYILQITLHAGTQTCYLTEKNSAYKVR